MKSVHIHSFFGPYFPVFGLNTEKYGVSIRIQSECRKIRTRKTPNTDTFHAVGISIFSLHAIQTTGRFSYSPVHNILEYYKVLLQVSLTKNNGT